MFAKGFEKGNEFYYRNGIYTLMVEGYRPIHAHVEHYSKINVRTDRV